MSSQIIALIDWRWAGHHPNYFVNYAVAMAKAGYRVIPFCNNPDDFTSRLSLKLAGLEDEGYGGGIAEPAKLEQPMPSKMRPARFRGIHDAWRRFGGLGKRLRLWEKSKGVKINLVFFACIYDKDFQHFDRVEKRFGFSWSGLYLHARSFRLPNSPVPYSSLIPCPEKIFSSSLMHSAAVIDEGAIKPMGNIAGGKPIVLMPDFTDEHLPASEDNDSGLGHKIISFAQGRPIISLVGHLQQTKGIENFTAIARQEGMQDVVFFIGGELSWYGIDSSKRKELTEEWANSRNIFTHLLSLTDAQMNAAMSASDIIYAAYLNFPNSSNIMTKAALLKKPMIVSDGYLMAERVHKYAMGEVVAEGNQDEIFNAIQLMLTDDYSDHLQSRARWEEYHAQHVVERLPECFERLLSH
jgi:hypothetical protein